MRERKWTKESIINEIKAKNINGLVKSTDVGPTVSSMSRRMFGSFSNACKEAGLSSYSLRPIISECQVDGCSSPPRSKRELMCEMHYGRVRRNGHTKLLDKATRSIHTNGYIKVKSCGHPMAMGDGWSYEHRFVYYNKNGRGPFSCHWCDSEVSWDVLHIDHLDDNKQNNDISNLVASCSRCNISRGMHKSADWSRRNGRIIEFNGKSMCVSEWARSIGISPQSLTWRLSMGWSVYDALTRPKGNFGPKPHHKQKSLSESNKSKY